MSFESGEGRKEEKRISKVDRNRKWEETVKEVQGGGGVGGWRKSRKE